MNLVIKNRYCWSICAFSIRLSFARRFWNQIFIWASDSFSTAAISNRRPRDMYSFFRNSCSSLIVCAPLNVVLCRLGLPSLRFLRATGIEYSIKTALVHQQLNFQTMMHGQRSSAGRRHCPAIRLPNQNKRATNNNVINQSQWIITGVNDEVSIDVVYGSDWTLEKEHRGN